MKARRKARTLALQVLYEIDCTCHALDDAFEHRCSQWDPEAAVARFARELVDGIWENRVWLDQMIHHHAPEWPLRQMALIDRNVLRMSIWEFAIDGSTPTKVAINEAVELAKRFGSDSSARFVNGVLGTLASKENEIRQTLHSMVEGQSSLT